MVENQVMAIFENFGLASPMFDLEVAIQFWSFLMKTCGRALNYTSEKSCINVNYLVVKIFH